MAVPQPPPFGGDTDENVRRLISYVQQLYQVAFIEGEVLTEGEQSQSSDFDPSSLPDPASTTLADAQQTANEAYELAFNAQADANTLAAALLLLTARVTALETRLGRAVIGTFTVTHPDSSAQVIFSSAMPDTSYAVFISRIAKTGTPAANSDQIDTITRLTTDFTITFKAAPGAGNAIDFLYLAWRPQA